MKTKSPNPESWQGTDTTSPPAEIKKLYFSGISLQFPQGIPCRGHSCGPSVLRFVYLVPTNFLWDTIQTNCYILRKWCDFRLKNFLYKTLLLLLVNRVNPVPPAYVSRWIQGPRTFFAFELLKIYSYLIDSNVSNFKKCQITPPFCTVCIKDMNAKFCASGA